MLRRLLIGVGTILVAFHLWLLGSQAWAGQLTDLALATRWLIAGGLLLGLRDLKRQGGSIFWGRKAVALWLLAALLHGPALADRLGITHAPATPGVVAVLVQVAAPAVVISSLILLLALVLAGRRRRSSAPRPAVHAPMPFGALSLDARLLLAPRPPPIR